MPQCVEKPFPPRCVNVINLRKSRGIGGTQSPRKSDEVATKEKKLSSGGTQCHSLR